MRIRIIIYRTQLLYRKHRKLINSALIFLGIYLLLNTLGLFYKPLSPAEILRKEKADAIKEVFLGFGLAAPIFFIVLQVIGFVAGYVFGWKLGVVYTMIGLTCGSFIVITLSRRLGRAFVERFKGAEAVEDFERLLF